MLVDPLILLKGCSSTVKSGLVKLASADTVDPSPPAPYATTPPAQHQKSIPSSNARPRPNPLQKKTKITYKPHTHTYTHWHKHFVIKHRRLMLGCFIEFRLFQRGAARVSSRSNSVLVPIAPRPSSNSPSPQSRPQIMAGSSPVVSAPQQQQQQLLQQPLQSELHQSFARSSMALPFTGGEFVAPALCSMGDVPVSLSMVSPLDADPTGRLLFGEAEFGNGGFSLEDLDVGALEREVLQEDWSWLSENAL
ncbi:hypothetical protein BDV37DRAFT_275085 [Aspergillus pseudonomiae]|uniref:Uncharacterized protein n=1 Tax=Aspergillus pseudonomiae TaxID=1506151 RepID=A0A5N7D0M2_9EURO|nr:uncharacterized protein BDV37DRAFT_275085 [Aspergillus pseudonomiae]KAE8399627.1 hypothetical protein BDV37DRAFT_275085 [Aspergillus pseudonomiae]